MTDFTAPLPGEDVDGTWLATVATGLQRAIPLKGVNITNAGAPIATSSGTTELDLSKYAMTGLTLVTGRYYRFVAQVTGNKTVSTDGFDFKLRVNTALTGTQVGTGLDYFGAVTLQVREVSWLFKGDASYTALYMSVVRTAGTGTFSYYGSASGLTRSYAMLYDVGDTDNWTDVA